MNHEDCRNLIALTRRSKTPWKQLKAYADIFNAIKPSRYLEIGSFEGRSLSLFSIFSRLCNPGGVICATSVDSWDGGDEHKQAGLNMSSVEETFDEVVRHCSGFSSEASRFEKIKSLSADALCQLSERKEFYDLILVDAGHKAKDVLVDLVLSWSLLKKGGIMILDDYTWVPMHQVPSGFFLESPRLGIDSFVNCFADEVTIISNQPLLQMYIQKCKCIFRKSVRTAEGGMPRCCLKRKFLVFSWA